VAKIDVYKEWLGIPEGPRPPDHYALLRLVQFEDDPEKIRKHYKKLNAHVRKYATGQYSVESQELLNELAKAMLCLTDAESKKEYDRSLGRVIDERDAATGRKPLTAYLQEEGVLTGAQVNEVKSHADRIGLTLRDAVVQMKLATVEQATRAYANELGLSYIDLTDMVPEEAALDALPKNVVRRYTCLPLFVDAEKVLVACADEPSHDLEEEIRLRFGRPMKTVLATPQSIKENIDRYYAPGMRKEPTAPAKASGMAAKTGGMAAKIAQKVAQQKPVSSLSPEERAERRNLGIVLACMTFVILGNLDTWVLWDLAWRHFLPLSFQYFPFVGTLILGGPVLFVIWQLYFKSR
jgi:hypothetical protein